MPAGRIRLFINSEVISGPDSQRSSKENVVLQEPLEELHRAFVGQTELRQKQASGLTHVPKDETAADLSQGLVQEETRDIDDELEEEHKTPIQEAQKGLEHLSLTGIETGLEGTTHTMKMESREEAYTGVGGDEFKRYPGRSGRNYTFNRTIGEQRSSRHQISAGKRAAKLPRRGL